MAPREGATRGKLKDRKSDFYPTPDAATLALLRAAALPPDIHIWEPCAGRGAISRLLRLHGHPVVAHDLVAWPGADPDIQPGIDFLMEPRAPQDCALIVTNPPYMLAEEFIRHGLALGCDVIMLLRLMFIEGKGRSDLLDKHCVQIWAGIERLPPMHRENWDGVKVTSSAVPFGWFKFLASGRDLDKPIELRRISWRL